MDQEMLCSWEYLIHGLFEPYFHIPVFAHHLLMLISARKLEPRRFRVAL